MIMILGRDFMRHIGIDNFFSTDTIWWINQSVKIKPPVHYDLMMMNSNCVFKDYEDEEALSEAYAVLFEATKILD